MSACRKRVHCILDDPKALAFAAGAALLQQQAQPPWLAWLMLLPLCVGLAVRVRPSGVPGGNDAAQQSKLRAARGKQRRLDVAHRRYRALRQPIAPRWAVVPVGSPNRFGHPNREFLERHRAAQAEVLRTDLEGASRRRASKCRRSGVAARGIGYNACADPPRP